MPAYLWMLLGAALFGAARWWLADTLRARTSCTRCSRASGHLVLSEDRCQGPHREAEVRQQYETSLRRQKEQAAARRRGRQTSDHPESDRTARLLRILKIGTITTRTGSRGNQIRVTGWQFDAVPGAHYDGRPSSSSMTLLPDSEPPEKTVGWTLADLHAMTHGGGCDCDVSRLAKTVQYSR